jgi:predicted transcriptional regulator
MDVATIHKRGSRIILTHLQEMNTIPMKKIKTTMSKQLICSHVF